MVNWQISSLLASTMAMSLDYRPSLRGRGDDTLMQQALPDLSSMPRLPDPSESCKGADRMIKMLHGTTTLAFKYKDGVVVCVDSRASSGTYVSSQTVKKVIEFNKMMVGTMAGGAADCFYWLNNMGMRCRLFELEHKEQITVAAASKLFSNITYNYKQYGLSIGSMICGWDKFGPQLYYVDSDGQRLQGSLFSVGSGSPYAYGVLDSSYHYDLTKEQALELAQHAIAAAQHRDGMSGGTMRLYHIDSDGWKLIKEADATDLYYHYMGTDAEKAAVGTKAMSVA